MMAVNSRGTLIAIAVIVAGGVIAALVLGRGEVEPAAPRSTGATSPRDGTPSKVAPALAPVAPAVPVLDAAQLARLAEESMSGPAATRLAAIEQLSRAPREQALPLLRRVLLNGNPADDRPAALLGLRELALAQGDGDGRIRDAVREAIYHGDDESLAGDAQETLDIISESETK